MATSEQSLNLHREPDAVRIGKQWWKLEVSAERIRQTIAPLREQVDRLKGLLMARPERGPVDYGRNDDQSRELARAIRDGLRELSRGNSGHGNVNNSGSSKLTAWILGVFGAVATILLSLTLQAVFNLRSDVSELKGQVSIIVSDRNRATNGRP
jgi:hypothetical protein